MDSWYSTSANLQVIDSYRWIFICGLKSNRRMHLQDGESHSLKKLSELNIPEEGAVYHMKGYGKIKVFRIIKDGKTDYYGTNNFDLTLTAMQEVFARRWEIEEYHRGVKQTVGIAKCQAQTKRSQRNHIFCSLLSFLALEKKRMEENITWYESKRRIIADALFSYLKQPMIPLPAKT
jgi:putative transposase